jgi:hypothetical protein
MNQEKQQELITQFPELFRQYYLPMQVTCMCWGIEVGDGWYSIVKRLCQDLTLYIDYKEITPHPSFAQIKEKFGLLRVYLDGGDEMCDKLIDYYEDLSGRTCEKCAEPGTRNGHGFIQTLCDNCKENK